MKNLLYSQLLRMRGRHAYLNIAFSIKVTQVIPPGLVATLQQLLDLKWGATAGHVQQPEAERAAAEESHSCTEAVWRHADERRMWKQCARRWDLPFEAAGHLADSTCFLGFATV